MRFWLVICAAPVSENPATVGMRDCLSRVQGHFAKKGQLATIAEWTVNQNCCSPSRKGVK